jgi:hypothetical protein
MSSQGKDRKKAWKDRQDAMGNKSITVMISGEAKDLLDEEREKTGETTAKILERALLNLLGGPRVARAQGQIQFDTLKVAVKDLTKIARRLEELAKGDPLRNDLFKDTCTREQKGEIYGAVERFMTFHGREEVPRLISRFLNSNAKYRSWSDRGQWNEEDINTLVKLLERQSRS